MPTLQIDLEVDAEAFARDGFLRLERLAGPATVATLRAAYDDLLDAEPGAVPTDRRLGDVTRQIMMPSRYDERFRRNEALSAARRVAEQLFGWERPQFVFDMLIYKPPGHPATTPWHQDIAYSRHPFAPAGAETLWNTIAQFWVPLDDVDETTGCMGFIPGVHQRPMYQHHVAGGDPNDDGRLLAITEPEAALPLDTAVFCPLPAGGCTVHSYGTPHYTGPNTSLDRHRRAYIFSLQKRDAGAVYG